MPGARAWFEVRRRETTEAVIGAVTGGQARPQLLVLGRYDTDHRLRPVGRTTPLPPDAARQLADHLAESGPGHPWTGVRFSVTWGSREILDPILLVPELVAEFSGDTAIDRGAWRTPCATCACAWTSPQTTCRRSARAPHPPPADRKAVPADCGGVMEWHCCLGRDP
ncbi:hypothetical protein ACWD0A_00735 [Streptomyces sp. NPDC002867]